MFSMDVGPCVAADPYTAAGELSAQILWENSCTTKRCCHAVGIYENKRSEYLTFARSVRYKWTKQHRGHPMLFELGLVCLILFNYHHIAK
jgi:hypothetical protein